MLKEVRDNLQAAIFDADRQTANKIIDSWVSQENNTYAEAITKVLEPTLIKIGAMWDKDGDLSLAQGYVASKIAEDAMAKLTTETSSAYQEKTQKRSVVIGNIEDDFHALGRRLVVVFLRASGWDVHDLGNDVVAEEFIETALETEARIIGVSAMMYSTAINICKVREEIDKHGFTHKIQLAVGGAVFKLRPDLVNEVGGDGTTGSAVNSPMLMENLWKKSIS